MANRSDSGTESGLRLTDRKSFAVAGVPDHVTEREQPALAHAMANVRFLPMLMARHNRMDRWAPTESLLFAGEVQPH